MGRVPKKRVLCQCVRNATKQYVALKFLGFLLISIVELKNGYFCLVLPVFWAFPVLGPIITSLASSRSNSDGPLDPKYPKKRAKLGKKEHFSPQQ